MLAATARLAGIVVAGVLFAVSAASAQETMKGGTITYAKPGEMISLDPHTSISGVDWRILYQIYEQLVRVNDDFTFAPGLATDPSESRTIRSARRATSSIWWLT